MLVVIVVVVIVGSGSGDAGSRVKIKYPPSTMSFPKIKGGLGRLWGTRQKYTRRNLIHEWDRRRFRFARWWWSSCWDTVPTQLLIAGRVY